MEHEDDLVSKVGGEGPPVIVDALAVMLRGEESHGAVGDVQSSGNDDRVSCPRIVCKVPSDSPNEGPT